MGVSGPRTSLFARSMDRFVYHFGELSSLDKNTLQSKRDLVIRLLGSILRRIDRPSRLSTSEKLLTLP